MKKVNIEGNFFVGPRRLGKDEIPAEPAIALIVTESGEGFQILSVVEGDNIAKEISESKWNDCWKKNGWNGVDIYIQSNDSKSQREMLRNRIRDKRRESIKCEQYGVPEFE